MSRLLVNSVSHPISETSKADIARRILLSGQVQGVGFRPFIYQLAKRHQLSGWVRNGMGLVEVLVQGQSRNIDNFLTDIFNHKPALAKPELKSVDPANTEARNSFTILESSHSGESHISVPVDLSQCNECLSEFHDPSDRRYHYPFINCTQCGPRYTLIRQLPYDRANTSMAEFDLCAACHAEYVDPENRRFHAEPLACPDCGPSLLFRRNETEFNDNEGAIKHTVAALRNNKVIAVKGIGGYHLMCDASSNIAVTRLRQHKMRPDKPLAVMFPSMLSEPFKHTERVVILNKEEKEFLLQPCRPILLVRKNDASHLSDQIAPGLNEIGIMLPYSPLHHLLLDGFDGPLVATSANISGEPVMTQQDEVETRLAHIADAFLHHNRPIERPADDPVYKTIASKPRPIRTGRGSAPLELALPFMLKKPVLAVGAHMKNTVTLAWDRRAIISPHIGEMDSPRSLDVFQDTIRDLQQLYGVSIEALVCDAHPNYTSTRWARNQELPVHPVHHHHAHASAAWYETEKNEPVISFTWDGTGYGEDGNLWGGETFIGQPGEWQRVASIQPFRLPGGDKAGRQPWRSAAALCWETGHPCENLPEQDPLLYQAWQRKINTPLSSSVGRLFDAASALTGLRITGSYEGQGPMEFEALCKRKLSPADRYIKLALEPRDNLLMTHWEPLVAALIDPESDLTERACLFHASLAHAILDQAQSIRSEHGINTVCFSGGVFQNRILSELGMTLLTNDGFTVHLPQLIPVNDAGISFGQIIEYASSQS